MEKVTRTFEGVVKVDPYGKWSDVDHGVYIDNDKISDERWSLFGDYKGKKIRINIEVLEENNNE